MYFRGHGSPLQRCPTTIIGGDGTASGVPEGRARRWRTHLTPKSSAKRPHFRLFNQGSNGLTNLITKKSRNGPGSARTWRQSGAVSALSAAVVVVAQNPETCPHGKAKVGCSPLEQKMDVEIVTCMLRDMACLRLRRRRLDRHVLSENWGSLGKSAWP